MKRIKFTAPWMAYVLSLTFSVAVGTLFAGVMYIMRTDDIGYAATLRTEVSSALVRSLSTVAGRADRALTRVSVTDPINARQVALASLIPADPHAVPGMAEIELLDSAGRQMFSTSDPASVAGAGAVRRPPGLGSINPDKTVVLSGVAVLPSKPRRGAIAFARVVTDARGVRTGTALAYVSLSEIESLFEELSPNEEFGVSLSTVDGVLLASTGIGNDADGYSTAVRLESFPLVVRVIQTEESVLRRSRKHVWDIGAMVVVLLLFNLVLILYLFKELRGRESMAQRLQGVRRQFSAILENLPAQVCYIDNLLLHRFANRRYLDWFGWTQEEVCKKPLNLLLDAKAFEEMRPHLMRALKGSEQVFERTGRQHEADEERCFMVSLVPDFDADRRVQGVFVQVNDCTDLRRTQDLLHDEKELLRLTLRSIGDAVICVDSTGRVTYINPVAESVTGWSCAEAAGLQLDKVAVINFPKGEFLASNPCRRALADGQTQVAPAGTQLVRRDGAIIHIDASFSPIEDSHGGLGGVVIVLRDTTESMAMARRMAHLAQYDALTDLPNRVLLADRAQQAIARAERTGSVMALMYIDLDGFKAINDSLGHDVGDVLLVEVARRLRSAVRKSDTVCRQGGDEFVVLVPSLDCADQVLSVARHIMASTSAAFLLEGEPHEIRLSGGIAVFPDHGATFETLSRHADMAMYAAKRSGRANFHVYGAQGCAPIDSANEVGPNA